MYLPHMGDSLGALGCYDLHGQVYIEIWSVIENQINFWGFSITL